MDKALKLLIKAKRLLSSASKNYLLAVGIVALLLTSIVLTILGPIVLIVIAVVAILPPWTINGYYLISKKVTAPRWAMLFLWYTSPTSIALIVLSQYWEQVKSLVNTMLIISLILSISGLVYFVYNAKNAITTEK